MCTRPEPWRRGHGLRRRQAGVTLVELIVALVLAGVILTSIWNAWTLMGRGGADPLVARQSLAIAQSLLREIELQPLPGTATAAATPGRTGFASIADYNGLTMTGITDVEGAAVPGLEAYGAVISVTPKALEGVPESEGWWVAISVTGPDGGQTLLSQWRARR
jgi:MSHA pilin protein MshD